MAAARRGIGLLGLAALGIGVVTTVEPVPAAGQTAGPVQPPGTTVLLESGGWSWFEDERALVDFAGGRLYVAAVASEPTSGEVVLAEIDLANGARRTVGLGAAELDDHNSAAIWESPGREVLTAWTRHGQDVVIRTHRRRTDGSWLRLPTVSDESAVTYNNLYSVLSEDGAALLYDFYRGTGFDPEVMASTDAGRTWSRLGRLLADPVDSAAQRPYVRYAGRGDRIDFISTEGHPDAAQTSIYHGYLLDGIVHRSDGTALGRAGTAIPVTQLTRVWTSSPTEEGWTVDLTYDRSTGAPIAAFSTTRTADDHRYYIGRWNGSTWQVQQVARAGRALYPAQADYTGLIALDPRDPDHAVISTDVNPVTGAALVSASDGRRHWELFDGTRRSDGTYAWTALTANSRVDNIRPVMTTNAGGAWALAWLRGRYTTYQNYDLEVVGVVRRANGARVATSASAPRRPVVDGIDDPGPGSTAAVPLAGRFDGHPAADVVLYRPGTARDDLVIGDDGRYPVHARARQVSGTYRPVTGDFDADGDTDIVWYAPGGTAESVWITQPDATWASRAIPAVNGAYTPIPGDFDRDGDTDILWYAPGGAADTVWITRGDATWSSRAAPAVNGTYTPIPGDFDRDGDTDILWYGPGGTAESIWITGPDATWSSRAAPAVNGTYTPVPGDFDADGDTDIVWYAPGSGTESMWTTGSGATWTSRSIPAVNQAYRPVADDLDGNGADDVLWYGTAAAGDYVWWSAAGSPLGNSARLALNL
jgi:hypothetical protein